MRFFILCIALYFMAESVKAQIEADTTYYQIFPDELTTRFYFSRKFTSLILTDGNTGNRYRFEPNSTLNMGVGATYDNLTLNLAYGFGFLNPDRGQGDSKYLDLQAHLYPKNMVIDFFGQFYNGYHVDQGHSNLSSDRFVVLPDMKIRKIGASVQYLFRGNKLSLRAAFQQNEWQKRSASSPLLGFELYGGQAANPGGMLITSLSGDVTDRLSRLRFFELGPNAGYTGTVVIKKHFFISGSFSSNLSLSYLHTEDRERSATVWKITPNYFFRGFAGYNSSTWSVNANYVLNQVRLPEQEGMSISIPTGNYRVNLIYRFVPGPKINRHLIWIRERKEALLP